MKHQLMLLTLSVGMLTAACLPPAMQAAQNEPQRVEITARQFAFTPGEIIVKKGQPVVLVIHSADVEHGLRLREFGVNVQIKPGKTLEVKFTPDKVGDFVGHCAVFCGAGHGSMEIKVHVVA
jgi:cytochrome c oxidase subunit II